MFNQRFSEQVAPIGKIQNGSFSTPQNSGWIFVGDYNRIVVLSNILAVGTDMKVQVDLATDSLGSNIITDFRHNTTATVAPTKPDVIEIISTELGNPVGAVNGAHNYSYIRVVATPTGAGGLMSNVFGCYPRQEAVDQTLYNEVAAFADV